MRKNGTYSLQTNYFYIGNAYSLYQDNESAYSFNAQQHPFSIQPIIQVGVMPEQLQFTHI
jgi:hypothetical protein